MIDSTTGTLIIVVVVGLFFLLVIFVLPHRKIAEEKGKTILYEERCSVSWRYKWGITSGGNIPIGRITFYDNFFVVSFIVITKVLYSGVKSISLKRGWLSTTMTINLADSRSLLLHPRNPEKMELVIAERTRIIQE